MGKRITQRIYQCNKCGKTPDDGEYMWEMGREVWCEQCCDAEKDDERVNNLALDFLNKAE